MSDSPRWHLDGLPGTTGIVEVMLYDDHLAAVAAAEQRGYGRGLDLDYDDRIKAAFDYVTRMPVEQFERLLAALDLPAEPIPEIVQLASRDMHSGLACLTNYERGVKAAREAVEAENKNPISRVTTDYDIGYRDGTNDTVRLHLRAIDALLKEKS